MNSRFSYFAMLCFLCLGLVGCLDSVSPTVDQMKVDAAKIKDYATTNNLTGSYIKEDGIFYSKTKVGTGVMVNATDAVEVSYSLFTLDGIKIATSNSYTFNPNVGAFIGGLPRCAVVMQEGEKAQFILPSVFAFGRATTAVSGISIPANSVIRLEMEVLASRTEAQQETVELQRIRNYIRQRNQTITKEGNGVIYVRTAEATNPTPVPINTSISLNYVGKLLSDGSTFDQGTQFSFYNAPSNPTASRVIKGWLTGINMMQVGESGVIYITSGQAYSATGAERKIGPYATIFFEISNIN